MVIKLEKANNTVKLAKNKDLFFESTAPEIYELDDSAKEELIKLLLDGIENKDLKVVIKGDPTDFITLSSKLKSVNPVRNKNLTTLSSLNTQKYKASDIPGNFALLRDEATGLIYSGYRKHTFSYYNVCCVPDDIAYDFFKSVSHTEATKQFKTKQGKTLFSVDQRNEQLYSYWSNYMNTCYENGVK